MDRTKIVDGIRRWAWDAASQACAWEESTFLGDGWGQHAIRGMANQIEKSAGGIVDAAIELYDAVNEGGLSDILVAKKNLGAVLYGRGIFAGKEGDQS